MASQPTFDLHVPGRPWSSAMDWFSDQGFNTWTMDNEGYGRSDKHRNINFDISNGADDLAAGTEYAMKVSGATSLLMYGISSGALKAGLFTERHPERIAKVALDAFVWTGEGSHTLEQRRKNCRSSWPGTGARLTALSSTASFSATIRTRWSRQWSRHLPMPS